ncbi:type IV pilus biogenesis protein PilM [Candidatus Acidulodesulfobacterium sp. H_13]|uniref:type IV pilus biogenesis protein PilM n=1 Tax=Candidatus Acidulodesulfobacterium sp. H_13 TaxID=3395470 RepID=UPI003AF9FC98
MKLYTAIEIDYNQFKILEVYKKRNGYFLNNFINTTISEMDYRNAGSVSVNLKKIISENGISKKSVLTSIDGNMVHSFNFILPDMPLSDLKIAIEYELKKLLPFPLSQGIFDYVYSGKTDKTGNTVLNITVFAVREEDINNFTKIFTDADIKIRSIECKTVSIYNGIKYLSNNNITHLLFCDVGYKAVKIVIFLNDTINLERTIDGMDFRNMSYGDSLNLLSEELKRTVDFYFAGKSLPQIEETILTGIFFGKKDFDAKISKAVNLKTGSISLINLLKSRKYPFYLSKKLIKRHDIENDYDFFKPLGEMWTTFGITINR